MPLPSSHTKNTRVHGLHVTHDRHEVHLLQDLSLDIDSGCNLTQLYALSRPQAEHRALRDVKDRPVCGGCCREGLLEDVGHKFLVPTLCVYLQLAVTE